MATSAEFVRLHADAARAGHKAINFTEQPELAPLHRAVLTMSADLRTTIAERERAAAGLIYRLDDPEVMRWCPHYRDAASQDVKNSTAWIYDSLRGTGKAVTLNDYMMTKLQKRYSCLTYGPPACKSQICHMAGKTICIRKGLPYYAYGKAVDPWGMGSKWGILQAAAFLGTADFDFTTMRGEPLTIEEVKGLFDVQEGGSIRCRFHNAVLVAKQPRMFCVNGTTESLASELRGRGLTGLALMIEGRWNELSQQDHHQQAICRRVIVCEIKTPALNSAQIQEIADGDEDEMEAELAAEREWKRSRTGQ